MPFDSRTTARRMSGSTEINAADLPGQMKRLTCCVEHRFTPSKSGSTRLLACRRAASAAVTADGTELR